MVKPFTPPRSLAPACSSGAILVLVEVVGIEPTTFRLQGGRSPN